MAVEPTASEVSAPGWESRNAYGERAVGAAADAQPLLIAMAALAIGAAAGFCVRELLWRREVASWRATD